MGADGRDRAHGPPRRVCARGVRASDRATLRVLQMTEIQWPPVVPSKILTSAMIFAGSISVVSQGASMYRLVLVSIAALTSASAFAAPVTYILDPHHTYPSFEADHMGGLSVWRGKFTETAGRVIYDKDAKSGSIDITVNVSSIDFGMAKMDEHAKSPEIFDAEKYPTASYTGKFSKFNGATPTEAQGTLTLHGVTKPV